MQMLAFVQFEATREAFRQDWREAHKDGRSGSRDETSFAAMRNRMRLK